MCRGSSPWLRRGHGCDQCPLAVLSATFLLGICLALLPGNHKGNHEGNHVGTTWEPHRNQHGYAVSMGRCWQQPLSCLCSVFLSWGEPVHLVLTSLCGTWETCPCRTGLLSRFSPCFQPLAGGSYHRSWFQLILPQIWPHHLLKKGYFSGLQP